MLRQNALELKEKGPEEYLLDGFIKARPKTCKQPANPINLDPFPGWLTAIRFVLPPRKKLVERMVLAMLLCAAFGAGTLGVGFRLRHQEKTPRARGESGMFWASGFLGWPASGWRRRCWATVRVSACQSKQRASHDQRNKFGVSGACLGGSALSSRLQASAPHPPAARPNWALAHATPDCVRRLEASGVAGEDKVLLYRLCVDVGTHF